MTSKNKTVVTAEPGKKLAALEALVAERGQQLGIEDPEMEIKGRYERALHDGRYVLRVHAPSAERKERATEILRDHGAHTVAYHGRFTIEGIVPPAREG